ncbi:hypothetical protein TGCAST_244120 [Toxoplasma gondii CAST]|uniref:CW-type domain-containing protein n=1 Tax=Toxoplasma gondii CAST TaxID=943122 RepID=A0A3R8AKZ6_TOXGO|nr:hypothetical protein TGCAST_244120 [Toxoplasma gondii CAST]
MQMAACGEEKAGPAASHGLCYDEWMQCEKCERWRRCPSGTAEAFAATSFSCDKSFWESVDRRSCATREEDWRGQVVTLHDTGGEERRWNRLKRPKVEARSEKEEGDSSQQLSPSFRLPSSPAAFSAAGWLSTAGACSETRLHTAPDSVAAAAQRRRPPGASPVSLTAASLPAQRHTDGDRGAEGDRARERASVEENPAPCSSLRRAAEMPGRLFACKSEKEGGGLTASLGSPRPQLVGDFERPREPHLPCLAREKRLAFASFAGRQPELCRESRDPEGGRAVAAALLRTLNDALASADSERLRCSPSHESLDSPQVSFARQKSAGSLLPSPRPGRCGETKETRHLQSREEAEDRTRRACLEFLWTRMQSLKDSSSSSPPLSSSFFSSLARVPVDALAAVVARELADGERVSINSQRFPKGDGGNGRDGEGRAFSREREAGKEGTPSHFSPFSSQRRTGGMPSLGGERGEEVLWRRCLQRERMQTEDSDGASSLLPGLHLPRERLCGERLSPLGGDTSAWRRAISAGGNTTGVRTETDIGREGDLSRAPSSSPPHTFSSRTRFRPCFPVSCPSQPFPHVSPREAFFAGTHGACRDALPSRLSSSPWTADSRRPPASFRQESSVSVSPHSPASPHVSPASLASDLLRPASDIEKELLAYLALLRGCREKEQSHERSRSDESLRVHPSVAASLAFRETSRGERPTDGCFLHAPEKAVDECRRQQGTAQRERDSPASSAVAETEWGALHRRQMPDCRQAFSGEARDAATHNDPKEQARREDKEIAQQTVGLSTDAQVTPVSPVSPLAPKIAALLRMRIMQQMVLPTDKPNCFSITSRFKASNHSSMIHDVYRVGKYQQAIDIVCSERRKKKKLGAPPSLEKTCKRSADRHERNGDREAEKAAKQGDEEEKKKAETEAARRDRGDAKRGGDSGEEKEKESVGKARKRRKEETANKAESETGARATGEGEEGETEGEEEEAKALEEQEEEAGREDEEKDEEKDEEEDEDGPDVLEIGTGPYALLAVNAARAGARRVVALEADKHSASSASRFVQLFGFDKQVSVLHAYSSDVTRAQLAEQFAALPLPARRQKPRSRDEVTSGKSIWKEGNFREESKVRGKGKQGDTGTSRKDGEGLAREEVKAPEQRINTENERDRKGEQKDAKKDGQEDSLSSSLDRELPGRKRKRGKTAKDSQVSDARRLERIKDTVVAVSTAESSVSPVRPLSPSSSCASPSSSTSTSDPFARLLIIHEIIGDFAGNEGVADVVRLLQHELRPHRPRSIPLAARSFILPCMFPTSASFPFPHFLHKQRSRISPRRRIIQAIGLRQFALLLASGASEVTVLYGSPYAAAVQLDGDAETAAGPGESCSKKTRKQGDRGTAEAASQVEAGPGAGEGKRETKEAGEKPTKVEAETRRDGDARTVVKGGAPLRRETRTKNDSPGGARSGAETPPGERFNEEGSKKEESRLAEEARESARAQEERQSFSASTGRDDLQGRERGATDRDAGREEGEQRRVPLLSPVFEELLLEEDMECQMQQRRLLRFVVEKRGAMAGLVVTNEVELVKGLCVGTAECVTSGPTPHAFPDEQASVWYKAFVLMPDEVTVEVGDQVLVDAVADLQNYEEEKDEEAAREQSTPGEGERRRGKPPPRGEEAQELPRRSAGPQRKRGRKTKRRGVPLERGVRGERGDEDHHGEHEDACTGTEGEIANCMQVGDGSSGSRVGQLSPAFPKDHRGSSKEGRGRDEKEDEEDDVEKDREEARDEQKEAERERKKSKMRRSGVDEEVERTREERRNGRHPTRRGLVFPGASSIAASASRQPSPASTACMQSRSQTHASPSRSPSLSVRMEGQRRKKREKELTEKEGEQTEEEVEKDAMRRGRPGRRSTIPQATEKTGEDRCRSRRRTPRAKETRNDEEVEKRNGESREREVKVEEKGEEEKSGDEEEKKRREGRMTQKKERLEAEAHRAPRTSKRTKEEAEKNEDDSTTSQRRRTAPRRRHTRTRAQRQEENDEEVEEEMKNERETKECRRRRAAISLERAKRVATRKTTQEVTEAVASERFTRSLPSKLRSARVTRLSARRKIASQSPSSSPSSPSAPSAPSSPSSSPSSPSSSSPCSSPSSSHAPLASASGQSREKRGERDGCVGSPSWLSHSRRDGREKPRVAGSRIDTQPRPSPMRLYSRPSYKFDISIFRQEDVVGSLPSGVSLASLSSAALRGLRPSYFASVDVPFEEQVPHAPPSEKCQQSKNRKRSHVPGEGDLSG